MTALSEDEELQLALALSASEAESKLSGHKAAHTPAGSHTTGQGLSRHQLPQQAQPAGVTAVGPKARPAAGAQAAQFAAPTGSTSTGSAGGLGEQLGRLTASFKRLLRPSSDGAQRPLKQREQEEAQPQQPSWVPVGMPVVPAEHSGRDQHIQYPPAPSAGPSLAGDEALARALQEQFDREEQRHGQQGGQQQQQQHPQQQPQQQRGQQHPQQPVQPAPAPLYNPYSPAQPSAGYPSAPFGQPPLPKPGELPAVPYSPGPKPAHQQRPAAAAASARPGTCAGCGQSLLSLSSVFGGGYITALGRSWHPGCLKCAGCGGVLAGGGLGGRVEFTVGSDEQPYHPACHKELHHPRCKVCGDFVPSQGGRIEWSETPFWRDKSCPCHNSDGTHRCTGCNRYQPRGEEWADLDDGRKLCLECLQTMVADTAGAQPLYDNILQYYATMGMRLPVRPPMMLVESGALNQAEQREGRGHESGPVFHTRGLCLTEEWTSFTSVMRVPRGAGALLGGLLGGGGNGDYSLAPRTVQLGPTRTEVTAILVLYGLPWLLTGSILAHECMHAWLRLHGYKGLAPQVEEGMCQLMALLWLEAQPQPKDTYEERLASYLAHQIRTDPSTIYGDGFRDALEAFQRFGLQSLLAHLRQTGQLPS